MALTEKVEEQIRGTLKIYKNKLDFHKRFVKEHPEAKPSDVSAIEEYVAHVSRLLGEIDDQREKLAKLRKSR